MALQAKELMIGDWIRFKDDLEMTQISAYGLSNWIFDDIEPIPLTEEILKMNGFTKEHLEYEEYMWKHPYSCTFLTQYNTHGTICLESTDIELNYVHELQRALKCCELWELADNLKVKI